MFKERHKHITYYYVYLADSIYLWFVNYELSFFVGLLTTSPSPTNKHVQGFLIKTREANFGLMVATNRRCVVPRQAQLYDNQVVRSMLYWSSC